MPRPKRGDFPLFLFRRRKKRFARFSSPPGGRCPPGDCRVATAGKSYYNKYTERSVYGGIPMGKGRSDGEITRRMIIERAKELFARKGYGAVSMNEICEAAGVSKGSLYHHFAGKKELFLTLVEENIEHWKNQWEEKRRNLTSATDQLYALAEHYADEVQDPLSKALEEFVRSHGSDEATVERLWQLAQSQTQACREVLREGTERGEFVHENLEDAELIVSALFEGLGKIFFDDSGRLVEDTRAMKEEAVRVSRKAVRMLLHGIAA